MKRARFSASILLAGWLALLGIFSQAAELPVADARIALVVGNGAYKSSPLNNPVNDARAITRALKELGFEVLLRENLTQQGFLGALREFGTRLKDTGGVGLFYYAGHGMQVKGANYLIPVDAAIEGEDEVRYLSIDANQVLDKMDQAGNRLNIVILDACRDNPFARSFRSKQSGLAQMDAPSGMLVAFATAPGAVAYDGDGVNGVYTKHLLRNLAIPGLPIELVLKRVREGVSKDTGQKQVPWETSSLLGDFYFRPALSQASAAVGSIDPAAVELAFWDSVKNSNAAGEYRAYLDKYPAGQFATLANTRINALHVQPSAKPSASPTQIALAQPGSAAAPLSSSVVKVGDTWTYNILDRGRKADTLTASITSVAPGGQVTERLTRGKFPNFSVSRTFEPEFDPRFYQEIETPGQMYLPEFSPYVAPGASLIGEKWDNLTPALTAGLAHGTVRRDVWSMKLRVLGSEKIRLPAGEFMTIKVEAVTNSSVDWGGASLKLTYWYAPQVKRTVRFVREVRSTYQLSRQEEIYELINYKLGE